MCTEPAPADELQTSTEVGSATQVNMRELARLNEFQEDDNAREDVVQTAVTL